MHLTEGFKICVDIDTDKHFCHKYNNIGNKYYLEEDFNQLLAEKNIATNFSLIHLNSRSLFKNLDQLINYLNIINHRFTVSETWGNVNNEMFLNIPGFNHVLVNRKPGTGEV